ncbi:unnamed protein product [Lupinus luteus]|uniref:Uncharacterized protein n=1 Tax=Lupinus luteus TaxID=3873 RepID=A0AAV1XKC1_LUPLU
MNAKGKGKLQGKKQPPWRVLSLKELLSATNNFNYDNKLSEVAFGNVYWGQLWNGSGGFNEISKNMIKKFSELADPRLNGNYVEEELKRVILVALICAQNQPEKRPTMLEVVELLRGKSKAKLSQVENSELFKKCTSVGQNDL